MIKRTNHNVKATHNSTGNSHLNSQERSSQFSSEAMKGIFNWKVCLCLAFFLVAYVGLPTGSSERKWSHSNSFRSSFHDSSTVDTAVDKDFSILISSHRAFTEYFPATNTYKVLDTGHGVYYGQTVLSPSNVYITGSADYTEPKNKAPGKRSNDILMRFDIEEKKLDVDDVIHLKSFFTHDSIAHKGDILVTNTFSGTLDIYTLNRNTGQYAVSKTVPFGKKSHINSIATFHNYIFVMLNNLGPSNLAVLDGYEKLCTVVGVGINNHNIIIAEESTEEKLVFYSLSSNEGQLVKVTFSLTECKEQEYVQPNKEGLYQYPKIKSKQPFPKGLMVVNHVALFAVSPFTSGRKERAYVDCRLVAFDILKGKIIFDRSASEVGTEGLVNVIGSPLFSSKSTFTEFKVHNSPFESSAEVEEQENRINVIEDVTDTDIAQTVITDEIEQVDPLKSNMANANYLSRLLGFSRKTGIDYGYTDDGVYFIKLPLKLDVAQLRADLDTLLTTTDWTYRADVNNFFLLLVTNKGNPTDETKVGPFLPVGDRLEKASYSRNVMASLGAPVGRSRYMMLPAGQNVNLHKDRVAHVYKKKNTRGARAKKLSPIPDIFGSDYRGDSKAGYWGRRFRVHIPVYSNSKVLFSSEKVTISMEPGYAYLFDNASPHKVMNPSDEARTHLVFDTVSSPRLFELVCNGNVIIKSKESAAAKPVEVPFLEYYKEPYQFFMNNEPIGAPANNDFSVLPNGPNKKIYYEYWLDKEVFWPMEVAEIEKYWEQLSEELASNSNEKDILNQLLKDFLSDYETKCYQPFLKKKNFIKSCEGYVEQFEEKLAQSEIAATKESTLEIDLYSALEALIKNIFYQCKNGGQGFEKGPSCFA